MVVGELTEETQLLIVGGGPGGYVAARCPIPFRRTGWGTDSNARMVEIGPSFAGAPGLGVV